MARKKKSEEEKTHVFSMWLLKDGISVDCVKKKCCEKYGKGSKIKTTSVLEGATVLLWKNESKDIQTWWQKYWALSEEDSHSKYNGIILIPVEDKIFAITHGYTSSVINDEIIDTRFGTLVVLNALDPKKLATVKVFQPDNSLRQLTQRSSGSGIIYLDQLGYSTATLLNDLSGKVVPEYESLFSSISGGFGKSLKIKGILSPEVLPEFLKKILEISKSDDYKTKFPSALQFDLERDPEIVKEFDDILLEKWHLGDSSLQVDIPEITDTFEWEWKVQNIDEELSDINEFTLDAVKARLQEEEIDISKLKRTKLCFSDKVNSIHSVSYNLYDCLTLEIDYDKTEGYQYYLAFGQWFRVDGSYVENIVNDIKKRLNGLLDNNANPFSKIIKEFNDEKDHNIKLTDSLGAICLDGKNIAPKNQTEVEPCDIFYHYKQYTIFVHSKIYRGSPSLSHLFNQGLVSARLIRSEQDSREKLAHLINSETGGSEKAVEPEFFQSSEFDPMVLYYIIAPQNRKRPLSLETMPLFSKITLRSAIATLESSAFKVAIKFVP